MLSFLYPAFLVGAAAAAIPILLHMLRNQQAPELRFSAVRLLQGVRVEQSQRRRIRDWLLLALRVSALVLLALSFARPYVTSGGAAGGRATIVALDRSASMGAPDVWSRARDEARRAIERHRGEPVGLLAFDDVPELLVAPTRDQGALSAALGRLTPGVGATQFAGALSHASAALEEAGATAGSVVVISDLQGGPADARGAIPRGFELRMIDVGRPFDNLALVSARRRVETITATVRNDAARETRVRIAVLERGSRAAEAVAELHPGEVAEVAIPARATGELEVVLEATDPLAIDNTRYVAAGEPTRPRVLILADAGEAFYLRAALGAGAPPEFDVTLETAARLGSTLARRAADVVVIVSPRGLDRGGREGLRGFVEAGGGLFVVAGADGRDALAAPLLDGLQLATLREDRPMSLAAFESHHPVFQEMSGAHAGLSHARFTRSWDIRTDAWKTIARFDDGGGALAERVMGDGRIVVLASDLNRSWNDLPLQPAFVPFVQELVRYLSPRTERDQFTPASLPKGIARKLGFAALESGRRVAVNLDPRESDPARMTAAAFTASVRRIPAAAPAVQRHRLESAESSQALWRYGLMVMLAALVLEGILARRPRVA
jgi:hypothetical protein